MLSESATVSFGVKLSLTTKIFCAFGFTLALFAAIAFVSVREFHAMGDDLRSLNEGHLALARLAGQLETHQQNRFRDLRRGLVEPETANRAVVLRIAAAYFPEVVGARLDAIQALAHRELARLGESKDEPRRRDFFQAILRHLDHLRADHETLDELTEGMLAAARAGEATDFTEAIEALEASLRAELYQLNEIIDDATTDTIRRAERDERNAIWRLIIMSALALLVGIVLTLLTARALNPIHELVAFARALSRGDYGRKIAPLHDDELAALAEALDALGRARKEREDDLDRQQDELERAYHRVAELKRYHESVVQSLRTAVIVTDRELMVTSANQAALARFGLRGNEVPDRQGSHLLLVDAAIGRALIERVGSLQDVVAGAHTKSVSALVLDDEMYDVLVAPFRNERGQVLGLVLAIEDVTEAARTKEALIRSERLAAIGRMSAKVTHEIRNPLSSIGLNAELLESLAGKEPEETLQLCQAIIREVDRLTAITDEYLRFARLPRPELDAADAGALVRSIAEFVRRDCEAASVRITVTTPAEPAFFDVDEDQMRQAILNLVRNAKESMPQGGTLSLSVGSVDGATTIAVTDTGSGIDDGAMDRIFDPFYSTKATGTGLGLALVQQIVTEHGGRLEVDSGANQGTEFRIVMPCAQVLEIKGVLEDEEPSRVAADG